MPPTHTHQKRHTQRQKHPERSSLFLVRHPLSWPFRILPLLVAVHLYSIGWAQMRPWGPHPSQAGKEPDQIQPWAQWSGLSRGVGGGVEIGILQSMFNLSLSFGWAFTTQKDMFPSLLLSPWIILVQQVGHLSGWLITQNRFKTWWAIPVCSFWVRLGVSRPIWWP